MFISIDNSKCVYDVFICLSIMIFNYTYNEYIPFDSLKNNVK